MHAPIISSAENHVQEYFLIVREPLLVCHVLMNVEKNAIQLHAVAKSKNSLIFIAGTRPLKTPCSLFSIDPQPSKLRVAGSNPAGPTRNQFESAKFQTCTAFMARARIARPGEGSICGRATRWCCQKSLRSKPENRRCPGAARATKDGV